jgi:hypothetical protein
MIGDRTRGEIAPQGVARHVTVRGFPLRTLGGT